MEDKITTVKMHRSTVKLLAREKLDNDDVSIEAVIIRLLKERKRV